MLFVCALLTVFLYLNTHSKAEFIGGLNWVQTWLECHMQTCHYPTLPREVCVMFIPARLNISMFRM